MSEFLKLVSPAEARSALLSAMRWPVPDSETVSTSEALYRVISEDVIAPHALPEFSRSTVDGFAVNARDTFGASPAQPAYLRVVGEISMGEMPSIAVHAGECAAIHTGGMLPEGMDSVVMLEYVSRLDASDPPSGAPHDIEVVRSVAPGENVIQAGEDVKPGQVVLRAGTKLGPAAIGGLMALGLTSVSVRRKPIVGLISSGDEVVSPTASPRPGQVRDVNGPALAALVAEAGGMAEFHGIVPDIPGRAQEAARRALSTSDAVVITAGSSASARDMTAAAIAGLGSPGVLVHGINIRPGKPTIVGVCDGKAVIGLPGNPVSALVIARLILVPAIWALSGMAEDLPKPSISARLTVNLASQAGREDWWPVRLHRIHGDENWEADPIFGRSNLIFSLAAANGLIRIPAAENGLDAGATVEVEPL